VVVIDTRRSAVGVLNEPLVQGRKGQVRSANWFGATAAARAL